MAWALAWQGYLTGDLATAGHAAGHYPLPPRVEVGWVFVARNGSAIRAVQVSFELGEVLP